LNTDLDAEYTCQYIELNPDNYQDDLDPWESVTIPLRGLSNFSQVRISWHIPNLDGDIAARTGAQNLPNADEWVANDFAAMLRTTVVDTPSGNFNQSQVSSQTGFLNPHASGGSASLGSGFDGDILNADCDDSISSGYAC